MTDYKGIDYSLGRSNFDKETGISRSMASHLAEYAETKPRSSTLMCSRMRRTGTTKVQSTCV